MEGTGGWESLISPSAERSLRELDLVVHLCPPLPGPETRAPCGSPSPLGRRARACHGSGPLRRCHEAADRIRQGQSPGRAAVLRGTTGVRCGQAVTGSRFADGDGCLGGRPAPRHGHGVRDRDRHLRGYLSRPASSGRRRSEPQRLGGLPRPGPDGLPRPLAPPPPKRGACGPALRFSPKPPLRLPPKFPGLPERAGRSSCFP